MREHETVPGDEVHVRERQAARAGALFVADNEPLHRENPFHARRILLRLVDPEKMTVRIALFDH